MCKHAEDAACPGCVITRLPPTPPQATATHHAAAAAGAAGASPRKHCRTLTWLYPLLASMSAAASPAGPPPTTHTGEASLAARVSPSAATDASAAAACGAGFEACRAALLCGCWLCGSLLGCLTAHVLPLLLKWLGASLHRLKSLLPRKPLWWRAAFCWCAGVLLLCSPAECIPDTRHLTYGQQQKHLACTPALLPPINSDTHTPGYSRGTCPCNARSESSGIRSAATADQATVVQKAH